MSICLVDGGEVYMNETRARRRIIRAAEARGYTIKFMVWSATDTPRWALFLLPGLYGEKDTFLAGASAEELLGHITSLPDARAEEEPKCRTCGSKQLAADPAGYYCDAYIEDGAPLLCLECGRREEKTL